MNNNEMQPPGNDGPPIEDEAPQVDVGPGAGDVLGQAGVEETMEAAVPEGAKPEVVPPPAEVEKVEAAPEPKPEAPPGFRLIPEGAVTRLEEVSAGFKGKPRIIELAKQEPEVGSALEELGRAIGGVTVPRSDETEQRRGFGEAKPRQAEETPGSASQEAQAMSLLLGGVGAILLYSIYRKRQQEQGAAWP